MSITFSNRSSALTRVLLLLALPSLTTLMAQTGIVAPGAKLVRLADGFSFTEGPAADPQGNIYFTDQPNDKILEWSVDGKLSVFSEKTGRANGLYFDRQGNLLACADLDGQLWSFDASGKPTVLVPNYNGKRFNGPNDLWIAPNGGIYFTDPYYQRDYWNHTEMTQDRQAVYYLSPDRKKLIRVVDDLVQPNGVIGTPDGKHLYVADIRGRKTYVYDINADGTLSGKSLFVESGSDGMTMDNAGNIYLCSRGVNVYNPAGEQIDHIDVPARAANVTFGGKDNSTLFITAMDGLYSIRTRVAGSR